MSIDFSCQDKTPELCAEARAVIAGAKIIIVGVGALGTTAAQLLVRSGAEHLVLVDDDVISADNLPRQMLFDEADVSRKKVVVAREKLLAINGVARVGVLERRMTRDNAEESLQGGAIVLDCTDNIETRIVIDESCEGTPWVHAAATGRIGEVMAVLPGGKRYADVVKGKRSDDDCSTAGIMTIAAVLTATVQVSVALKILLGRQKEVAGKLFRIDAWNSRIEEFGL